MGGQEQGSYREAAATTIQANGKPYTVSYTNNNAVVVNGATLASGGRITVDGQAINNLGSSGVVVGTATVSPPSGDNNNQGSSEAATTLNVNGKSYTVSNAGNGAIDVNGATVSQGGSAATVDGQMVSAASGVVAIGTQEVTVANLEQSGQATANPTTVLGAMMSQAGSIITVTRDASATNVDIADGSIWLTVGGAAQTVDGVVLSAASNGIVRDGTNTVELSAITTSTAASPSASDAQSSGSASSSTVISSKQSPTAKGSDPTSATSSGAQHPRLDRLAVFIASIALTLLLT